MDTVQNDNAIYQQAKQTAYISFSLLLCTYRNDNPEHLEECIKSMLSQTKFPCEAIIVKDGKLTPALDEVIAKSVFPCETNIITLQTNQTLGLARAAGVKAAKHDWIALMDSDDIAVPDRFEKQLAEIAKDPNVSIVGGQIAEFIDAPVGEMPIRSVPTSHDEILIRAKKRNPFNAMTVMFRRDLALQAGNFRRFPGFEDYDLWMRMIKKGAVCANCQEVLVQARIGNGLYSRRSGFGYILNEWRMQRTLYHLKITNTVEFVRNVLTRIPVRLLPKKWLKWAYVRFGGRVVVHE